MKSRKKYIGLLIMLLLCFSAMTGYAADTGKTTVRIAITKTSNKNVQKAVKAYNADKDMPYYINLVEVDCAGISAEDFDGLIIPGGNHVHPFFYNAKVKCKKHKYDKKLDQLEINLVKKFMDSKKPVLGICRGAQLVNVALGGTLKQDIGKKHYKWALRKTKTVANSRMRKLFGKSVKTLHYHHQAVKKLGKNLKVTMKDTDGTIEAFEHKKLPVIGVQFHPESMYTKNKGKEAGRKFLTYFWGLCAGKVKY